MTEANITIDEVNLEDLIILGEDKKIPIIIEFPTVNDEIIEAKALVKQLTLKEIDNVKLKKGNLSKKGIILLEKALFKSNGEHFSKEELYQFPIGVINTISTKIMELSGVKIDEKKLKDF